MKIGLCGFALSGKTTLFEALTGLDFSQHYQSSPTKFMEAIVEVEDKRLNFLSDVYLPQKHTPAVLELIDFAGIVPKEDKINSYILSKMRNIDLIAIVLNHFSDTQNNLMDELKIFLEELIFADMVVLTNRIEKLDTNLKKGKNLEQRLKDQKELEIISFVLSKLEQDKKVDLSSITTDQHKILKCFQLFFLKPYIIIVNTTEANLHSTNQNIHELLQFEPDTIKVCAILEKDFSKLDSKSQQDFIKDWGVDSLVKEKIINLAYKKGGLISFFTVGKDECKAWTIMKGSTAFEAAGKIHSDIQRGFIRAEVVSYDDFYRYKSMKELKAHGLHRLEGKDYIVQDGDIILFRFNV